MDMQTLLLLIAGLLLLIAGGELLVRGASKLAVTLGIPPVIVGLTVVAFGTSTPELAVSIQAAYSGSADLAVANVVGSNIFNILFILGLSALISPLLIHSQMIQREVPFLIGISLLTFVLGLNGQIAPWQGGVLFMVLVGYTAWLVREAMQKRAEDAELLREAEEVTARVSGKKVFLSIFFVVIGLGLVMLGADWLVQGASALARGLGVSEAVIGLTIVAAGTSLPEVVASVIATIKGERDIAVGNVIGSNIYNLLAILGLSSLASPAGLNIAPEILRFDIVVMIFVTILCWPFFRSGRMLSRVEGAIFFSGYIAYTGFLIWRATAS